MCSDFSAKGNLQNTIVDRLIITSPSQCPVRDENCPCTHAHTKVGMSSTQECLFVFGP